MAKRKLEDPLFADRVPEQVAVEETFPNLFCWPLSFKRKLQSVVPRAVTTIIEKFEQGVFLCTDYSGVGSAEVACQFICETFKPTSSVPDHDSAASTSSCTGGLRCLRASDKCPACRKILCCPSHTLDRDTCVFGTLEERVQSSLVDKLEKMRVSFLQEANEAGGQPHDLKHFGAIFVEQALEVIRHSAESGLPESVWCYKHEKACPFQSAYPAGVWSLNLSGVSCTDWSALGSELGWLGPTSVSFFLWVRKRYLFAERITLLENVMGFDDSMLLKIFPHHAKTVFQLSPDDFGVPATRGRKYIVLFAKGVSWNPAIKDPVGIMRRLFTVRGGKLWGAAAEFCCAPQEMIDRHHAFLAVGRGFPAARPGNEPWSAKHVAKPGTLTRIREWEAIARSKCNLDRGSRAAFFMNATQNACRSPLATTIPALIMEKQRFLLLHELFEVQGFAMFERDSVPEQYMCPFRRVIFEDLKLQESSKLGSHSCSPPRRLETALTHSEVRRMAGNCMNMQCVGAVVMFILAFVQADCAGSTLNRPCSEVQMLKE